METPAMGTVWSEKAATMAGSTLTSSLSGGTEDMRLKKVGKKDEGLKKEREITEKTSHTKRGSLAVCFR
jgi:hypothetical protein